MALEERAAHAEPIQIPASTNGTAPPARTVPEELQLIALGHQEQARRDTLRQHSERHWRLFTFSLLGVCVLLVVLVVIEARRPKTFHAPVLPITVVDGKAEALGPPQDLYSYTPSDGQYMEKVGQWILHRRGRPIDGTLARFQVDWVFWHTCQPAMRDIRAWEHQEKPRTLSKRRVRVDIISVTKTAAPAAYTVHWRETLSEEAQQPVEEYWSGTLTVGRIKLSNAEMVLHNRLGICITAYDWSRATARTGSMP